ncbi:alpha-galactosidase, partial [Kineococcus glutinatus]|uniref:alpha-galactosidase n=1 Tax=Kineococcus glutinatus TaxID=1070872 RepID=UPI0031E51E2D
VLRGLSRAAAHEGYRVLVAGTPGFGFRHGEVWGVHVAWSGNPVYLVEHLPEGAATASSVLGGGEHLAPGEVRLAAGESYTTPEVLYVHSTAGLDGLSARLHERLRARPQHPRTPRPVVLNTWEAVYFDHDLATLTALADTAARIGVERFVLDDGWFGARRDDRTGLGDWYVSQDVWPQGLNPLFDHVRALGMQVGLWVEPEMVNPDSDLARAHPDWVLTPEAPLWRTQHVLDLAHPAAWEHLLERLDALVTEFGVDFLKWDHNRDLHVAEHRRADGTAAPGVHAQTVALYALLDELRRRHPGLEVESCASGGARVDLGILQRTDRIWASDTNDALERQQIQRWTALLVPPELTGAHVGPPEAHSTHRHLALQFRCATALFGHAGIEWDVTTCSPAELEVLSRWTALYKELRPLLHSGRVVRADEVDPGALLHGVVAADAGEAVFCWARLATAADAQPGRVRLPGLDPAARYAVRVRTELGEPSVLQGAPPPWPARAGGAAGGAQDGGGLVLTGAALGALGLPMPLLNPGAALLLHLVRT